MLKELKQKLLNSSSSFEKNEILSALPQVQKFLNKTPLLRTFLSGLTPDCESVFKQLIAIGQAERLFQNSSEITAERLRELLVKLLEIDHFYREIGGIIGYQVKVLELLNERSEIPTATYHSPSFLHFTEENEEVNQAISWGLATLPEIAEFYPLGGAADRLHLVDRDTGLELPAAKLPFAGKTLLEHLVRDLQARECLYFRLYGTQITTPIAIMTSHEKENHRHVMQVCSDLNWFGRPRDSFRFFTQPLVPAVNEKGDWHVLGSLRPLLKPGGHGAIWKLARDEGIFDWLEGLRRKKVLIRQINNPLAGLDYGLLAFTGYGCKQEMLFGFASCPRLLQAAEGVNVLIEKEGTCVLTNIEYCDFAKFGIEDRPLKEGEAYSRFSSNTNILFADLKAIAKAIDVCPFPGLLINLKPACYTTEEGEKKEGLMTRLESTMQNIADVFVEEKKESIPLKTEKTFVTYNQRHKTISTAKKAFIPGKSLQETPENCFYDLLKAHRELLEDHCGFSLPPTRSLEEVLKKGPEFLFLYHPALGPLYSLIRKKLQRGTLSLGSELILELAEGSFTDLDIQGSLQIIAEQPMGHFDAQKILHYSSQVGSCILDHVTVQNRGVDWMNSSPFWKMDLKRQETCKIILKGHSVFRASHVHFIGPHQFIVEDGMEMNIREASGKLIVETKKGTA